MAAGASAHVACRPCRCRHVRGNGRWTPRPLTRSCLGYRVGWHFGGQGIDSQTFAYTGVRELSDADLENPPTVGPERFPMEGIVLHVNRS